MIYGAKEISMIDGDVIITTATKTYIAKLKPGYPRTDALMPVTKQPVWQIECIETTIDTDNPTITTVTRKYPDGNEDYKFIINDYATYTYEFRH